MATTIDLKISNLLEDLNMGLTWLKKEDFGYGSIQEKYNMNDLHVKMIQKHPKLINVSPNIIVFNIIDDVDVEEYKNNSNVEPSLNEITTENTNINNNLELFNTL